MEDDYCVLLNKVLEKLNEKYHIGDMEVIEKTMPDDCANISKAEERANIAWDANRFEEFKSALKEWTRLWYIAITKLRSSEAA